MNLKDNKGYVGVDISISVIVLLILVPTIMGIVYNINSTRNKTSIKTGALNIVVNAIEVAKETAVSENDQFKISILNKIAETYNNNPSKANGQNVEVDTNTGTATIFLKNASYIVKIDVTDYADDKDTDSGIHANLVKTVKATVSYKIGKNEESMDLSTVVR